MPLPMTSFLRQTLALTRSNLRSLPRRTGIAASMVLSVALVVIVLLAFLSMAQGFRRTLQSTGAQDIAVVTSRGAFSESTSRLSTRQIHMLEAAPGLARKADGRALTSEELLVPVDAIRTSDGQTATLSMRGVAPGGMALHEGLTLSQGHMFTPGSAEIIVGDRLAGRYRDLGIGQHISFGHSTWTVVGHFSAGGSAFESEIMADAGTVQAMFDRPGDIQSMRAKLTSAAAFPAFRDYVETTLDMGLSARTEKDFFAAQAGNVSRIILFLGWPLAVIMAFGAAVGAMTTMLSSVSDRLTEIATVRALGYARGPVFLATLAESLMLTLVGCALGSALAWACLNGFGASTRGAGNTQLAFQLTFSGMIVGQAVVLALLIGVAGGGLPALRATRIPLRIAMSGRG
ncbi:ABC transporter permease [Pseudooceanicola sp. CBS1P-1]|uniref:FtsX-like permease family protein n=1 Tax=Pseudooceanicola albus TaxID=2692189 RepID=A0A6L7GA85_9RHOB|nr:MULTISPECIES: ABC transporter permease [Pseudooceanicola]MBT9386246.1 ABC transporter permease [Pseudooceanicola endophyticus]MXN20296.1 FtsX-like permease family protein [Pseudooceanicola albus]